MRGLAIVIVGLLWASGCDDGNSDPPPVDLGEVTVDMGLEETGTRATETLIGNLVADAFFDAVAGDGVDFAVVGGGGLRCPEELDAVQCEGFEIPAGTVNTAQLEIVLPFDNELVIKELTGAALISTLERSVSVIPSERKGQFLHPSAQLRYAADCALPAQTINADGTVIESEGTRVTTVTVGGVAIEMDTTYTVATTAFVGAGSDGHVQLGESTLISSTGLTEQAVVGDFIAANSPVTPVLDGRIELSSACDVQ